MKGEEMNSVFILIGSMCGIALDVVIFNHILSRFKEPQSTRTDVALMSAIVIMIIFLAIGVSQLKGVALAAAKFMDIPLP